MRTLARWHYHIRIKSSLILADSQGQRLCKVNEVKLAPRKTRCFHNVTLTGQRFGPVHVVVGRQRRADGCGDVRVAQAQIEEGFLDDKSGHFGLEASRLRDAVNLKRLVLMISTATFVLVSEGFPVVEQGLRRMLNPHWQRKLSCLTIGLRAGQYALARGQAIVFRLGLCGGADLEPIDGRTLMQLDAQITFDVGWTLIFHPLS